MSAQPPLTFSDQQLDAITHATRPLQPYERSGRSLAAIANMFQGIGAARVTHDRTSAHHSQPALTG